MAGDFQSSRTWSSPDVLLSAWNNPTGYSINSIRVVNGGSNYSSSPVVTVTGGSGSGLTIGAVTVSGGVITAIAVSAGGSSYNTPPTLTITDSTGSGATAYPVAAVAAPNQALGWAGLVDWYCGECVTSAPHGAQDRPVYCLEQLLRHVQGLEWHRRHRHANEPDWRRLDDRTGDRRDNLRLLFLGWAGQHFRFWQSRWRQ